ncbi:hypothetical protein CS053_05965 [Rhodanobacter glycinis]|uniref:Haem-binding uptake Tiki superfamily ChaN domain-containing protein n=2 Tax=Rhodanobacter glycinis TaxID=582702 RepID=A0A5B9DY62_9GAMM|nr:hypothetical protein CS053_05965 [Rhodanobacter glycinis]
MWNRAVIALCLIPLLAPCTAAAQSFDRAQIRLFKTLHRLPGALARYDYLQKAMPDLAKPDRIVAMQLLSSAECELGLYNQAILGFPLKMTPPAELVLPQASQWRAASAVDVISRLAADRRIVMINEAHHDAHTRVLALELLPRLRALGFDYFAAEALVDTDPGLEKRGYPTAASGTEYLQEPVYGEIVREAIRLGFTVVPYDVEGHVSTQARDIGQAENLYREVFARDAHARLFVLAGYAHIDKAKGRLGNVLPMAAQLQALTGFDPLSIDQTQFLETGKNHSGDYQQLIGRFRPKTASVLVNRSDGKVWSASPALYDANVILPPTVTVRSFGNDRMLNGEAVKNVTDASRMTLGSLTTMDWMQRPGWLSLEGARRHVAIDSSLCRMRLPCVVEATYADEPADAIAADRYAFVRPDTASDLYLRPGHYRLTVKGLGGKTLSQQTITVTGPRTESLPTSR